MPEYDRATARDLCTHMEIAYKELEVVRLLMDESDYNRAGFKKLLTQVANYVVHYKGIYADHLMLDMEEEE